MSPIPFLVALAIVTLLLSRHINKRRLNLPPGPPPDPILGNIRQMPFDKQEQAFSEWGRTYGDVIYTQILGRSMIILNSLKAARDLLEKRGAIYSCRPRQILICEMMGWHTSMVHMQYKDQRFHKHRRWVFDYVSGQALAGHYDLQREVVAQMLVGMLETPADFLEHAKVFSASIIMQIAYGHKVKSLNDRYFRLAEKANEMTITSGTSQGGMAVDFIPFLRYLPAWMPGGGFKRRALETRESVQAMHHAPFRMVLEKMAAGDLVPSFTSSLLSENENQSDPTRRHDHEEIQGAAGTLYAAAMDTTSATLGAFFLAMARNPDVFSKAQAEIDSVVGFDRLPEVHDRPRLPYVDCVLNELYRWHLAIPLGVPHRSTRDDQYRGFDIPEDSMIMANAWAMSRNEEMYENPEAFNPDRFKNLSSEELHECDPKNFVFGFGRRQCPGKDFADRNVWLVIVSVLASFDIAAPVDETGEVSIPPADYFPGFIRHVKPFSCKITPRNTQRIRSITELAFTAE